MGRGYKPVPKRTIICIECRKPFMGYKNKLHCSSSCKHSSAKYFTRMITQKAISNGELLRHPCIVCGEEKVDAHHYDYGKPFDITWLCRKHHNEWHLNNKPKQVLEFRLLLNN